MKKMRLTVLVVILVALAQAHANVFRAKTIRTQSLRQRLLSLSLLCLKQSLKQLSVAKKLSAVSDSVTIFKGFISRNGKWRSFLKEQKLLREFGSSGLVDYFDDFYILNLTLGTPLAAAQASIFKKDVFLAQWFNVVPDTGSSTVWVTSAFCGSPACLGVYGYPKQRFNTSLSSTYNKTNYIFHLQYGSGSSTGIIGTDFASLTYPKQKFGVAFSIATVFGYQPVDGIFGLGWPSLTSSDTVPPMQNILPQLDLPLFTVFFKRNYKYSETPHDGGQITFGALDNEHCSSDIYYVKLSSKSYWQFILDGVSIGNYTLMEKQIAISDTGTSWIAAPDGAVEKVAVAAGATYNEKDEIYLIDCEKQTSAPNITLFINGTKFYIPASEYIIDLNLESKKCVVTMFPIIFMGFGPQWILGATMIRSYCQIYDIGNAQLGFAKAIQEPSTFSNTQTVTA
uniref:Peptidase A1 domain-containing protein n=1 Tax=Syphacia muris TaxID=451379 RepID=A0A0N5AT66_9BILA